MLLTANAGLTPVEGYERRILTYRAYNEVQGAEMHRRLARVLGTRRGETVANPILCRASGTMFIKAIDTQR